MVTLRNGDPIEAGNTVPRVSVLEIDQENSRDSIIGPNRFIAARCYQAPLKLADDFFKLMKKLKIFY